MVIHCISVWVDSSYPYRNPDMGAQPKKSVTYSPRVTMLSLATVMLPALEVTTADFALDVKGVLLPDLL